ncbi:MAG: LPS export ABC transporter permease LptF [Desulfobacterales bacterium]|nr:LPS export ABC transporter permease LptF [Desulfobacterales bacterium]
MKLNSIIDRYILSEIIPSFLISILFLTFIFLMAKILQITNLIVNYNVTLSSVLLMILYTVPYSLVYVVPMSVMTAVLLGLMRLSSDNEIIALKAGGVTIYRLLPPVMFFSVIGCCLTLFMSVYGVPWGKLSFKRLAIEIAASNFDIGLKERTFNDSFNDVMLYVSKIDTDKSFKDVFIQDQRTKGLVSVIVAPYGELISSDKFVYHLSLKNGMISYVNIDKKTVNSIKFDAYELRLDLKKAASGGNLRKKDSEMSLSELWQFIKENSNPKNTQYYEAQIELHRKFSIPFACIALTFLSVPLGIPNKSARKSVGVGYALFFFLFYFLLLSLGTVFGETGTYPPIIGMWMPNIVLGGIGVYLLIRTAKEQPFQIDFILDFIKNIFKSKRK